MSIGYPVAKADVDNTAGGLVTAVWQDLDRVRLFKAWLDDSTHGTSYMMGALGYTSAEDTLVRASLADLDKLGQIAHGLATQAAANNFFFNARQLTGVIFTG